MKRKERVENTFIERMKRDYTFRTFIFSTLSLLITVAFAGYNVFLWFAYKATWNIGIAIYYALLVGIRAYILFSERKLYKSDLTDEQKGLKRKKLFLVQSIVLFVIDLALITPISLMVVQQKEINYSTIPAIATAAYTTYKIITATRNYIMNRKEQHLSVQIFKNLNFIDALVSVLTLQYTMIMTFGNGIVGDMKILCATSSFAIWLLLIIVSIRAMAKAIKLKRG